MFGWAFITSARLGRFLRCVPEKTLEGEDAKVKESVMGLELFDRRWPPTTRAPIPSSASKRGGCEQSSHEYCELEGASDLVLFEPPRGRYVSWPVEVVM
jgi:hypothetical protein